MFKKILTTFALICCMLLGASAAQARSYRSCYSNYSYTPSYNYVTREVFTPVAVPVVVPATVFQYLPALQPVTPVAPVAIPPVATQVPGVYNAPAVQGQQPFGTNEDRLVQLIDQRLELAFKRFFQDQGIDNGPPAIPGTPVGNVPPAQSDRWAQAVTLLHNNCSTCHTGPGGSGKVQLFAADGSFAPNVGADVVSNTIRLAKMPKAAKGDPNHPAAIKGADLVLLLDELAKQR